jgi:DNA-binding response OmpR family regulator
MLASIDCTDAGHMTPRLLIIEDDPATAQFLLAVLSPVATVAAVDTLEAASACVSASAYDLVLLDLNLPDGQGATWFEAQRAAGWPVPAIALSADLGLAQQVALKARGFANALGKPCQADAVVAAVRAVVPALATRWNDVAGLAASGHSAAILERLRGLFLDELPRQRERLIAARAAGDADAQRAVLHQMRSGCGLVGAEALGACVARLNGELASDVHWQAFQRAVLDLRPDLTP